MSVKLSDAQIEATLGEGNFLLTACPGSGKTTSIAGRVADLSNRGKRVALLSYTKIGRDELRRSIERQHGVNLGGDNFVGTIHSFISQYLVSPFAHVLTGSGVPVRVNEAAALAYDPPGVDSTRFHFDLSGALVQKYAGQIADSSRESSLEARKTAAKDGVVSYDDSLYLAFRLLSDMPDIAGALADRFDEIIVDEAQDANEVQLAMLRILKKAGLKSLVLVGDFDQSIYGFAGSRPELCKKLAADCGLQERRITENFRSSQLICNTTAMFRAHKRPDVAVGPHKDVNVRPVLLMYDAANPMTVLQQFNEEVLDQLPVSIESSACLTRSRALMQAIRGTTLTQVTELAAAVMRLATSDAPVLTDLRDIESEIIRRAFGERRRKRDVDGYRLRDLAASLVSSLPAAEGNLRAWLDAVDEMLDDSAKSLDDSGNVSPGSRLSRGVTPQADWNDRLGQAGDSSRVDSIHQAKGESIDAVLVVADPPREPWHTPQAQVWASALRAGANLADEELRIFYVAITRARKVLVLALPQDTGANVCRAFQSAGFDVR